MAKSRAALAAEITAQLPNNNTGLITPSNVRTVVQDIVDSAPNIVDEPPVTSVAGRTGAVTVTKSDVGLSSVDNTSDASKPISTATQAALDLKANLSALGTAAAKNVAASGNAATGEVVKGDDTRLTDSRTPTTHTHPSTQISDATTVGKAVMTAADAAAARSAIGAGTSSFDGTYSSLSGKPSLGDAAAKNTGTTAGTVAAGDDSRITGAVPATRTVNGHALSSDVTVSKSDVGLGNVDNTSDATKNSATATLSNKRITARTLSISSSATPSINTDSYDSVTITALAAAITSMTSGLSGTPNDFDQLMLRIKDNGTSRAITWGASFASRGATLPTATTAGKVLYVLLIWNAAASVWDCVSTAVES